MPTGYGGMVYHNNTLGYLSRLDFSTTKKVPTPTRAVFQRSCRELSLDVSVDVHVLLVVEQSSLESQSKG